MDLAKISANGQIVVDNASPTAIIKAQRAFSGAAEAEGIKGEADVQNLVDELRYDVDDRE